MKYILLWYIATLKGVSVGAVEFNRIEECMFAKNEVVKQFSHTFRDVEAFCAPKGVSDELQNDLQQGIPAKAK